MRAMLKIGDTAPEFSGLDQNGQMVSLQDRAALGPVVLYFYPRDFTSVCTRQACLFRDAYDELQAEGVQVIGVSVDSPDQHREFASQHRIHYPLLADPNRTISRAYGVLRPLLGVAKRVTFLIAPSLRIQAVFHNELRIEHQLEALRRHLRQSAGA